MIQRSSGVPLSATALASTTRTLVDISRADRVALQVVFADLAPAAVIVNEGEVDIADNTFTSVAHGYVTGLKVAATTDGTLPDPLSATNYFVIKVDADTFKVATTLANAQNGAAVDLADVGVDNTTFTPATSAGNIAKVQVSCDGTNWDDLGSFTVTIATTPGNELWDLGAVSARFLSVLFTPSAGQVSLSILSSVVG